MRNLFLPGSELIPTEDEDSVITPKKRQPFVYVHSDVKVIQDEKLGQYKYKITDYSIIGSSYMCYSIFLCTNIQCSLVKPPPSVQSVVWRYNEFGNKLRDIENRKSCDQMKR